MKYFKEYYENYKYDLVFMEYDLPRRIYLRSVLFDSLDKVSFYKF